MTLALLFPGQGSQSVKSLAEIFPEYKRSRVGPYLALVSANSVIRKDPALALTYFDWARLVAPGTIVEEAALRRSIYIASQSGWIDKSMVYANRYARRYLRSPYASQFAWHADMGTQVMVVDKVDLSRRRIYELPTFSFLAWDSLEMRSAMSRKSSSILRCFSDIVF